MAKLSLNGAEALAEIKKLIAEIDALKASSKSMSATTASNFASIEQTVNSLKSKVGLLANKINYLNSIIKAQNATLSSNTSAIKKNEAEISKLTNEVNKLTEAKKKGSSATNFFTLKLTDLIKGGLLLKITGMLKDLALNVYDNIKTFDSLSFTLEKITKNTFDYENSQRFLLRITQAYGVELVTTTQRWSRFLAAANESGLALRDTENIFESMTKASAALGLGTDELTSVYLALEQMLSKGKVTTEELRRQLGERLPGAMGIMAASMGVTIPVLDKMLKKGEVLSADVLPDFARAVERAYGIENADRIETLIAKQNRLTASWQTFIKNITEGDSVIKKVLGKFIDLMRTAISVTDYLFSSDEQKLRISISIEEDKFEKDLEKTSAAYIDSISELSKQEITLQANTKILERQLKTANDAERKAIKLQLEEIARIRSIKDKESVERQKAIAAEKIDLSFQEYEAAKGAYDKIQALPRKNEVTKRQGGRKISAEVGEGTTKAQRKSVYDALVATEARYNVFRKLLEESNVSIIDDDEPEKSQRRLREIKDFTLETLNEIAGIIKDNKLSIFGDETINLKDRLTALKDAANQELYIRQNLYKIQERDALANQEKEIASVNDSVSKGTLSRAKANAFIVELEKETNSKLLLEREKLLADTLDINTKNAEKIAKLTKEVTQENEVGVVSSTFNKRIIAAKEEYEQSKKNVKDREKLERELAEIAIESANAMIDTKIKFLEEEKRVLEQSGENNSEYIAKLEREIEELNANRQIKPPVDSADWREAFSEAMDVMADFNSAIGDLVDAQFERKIENIEAEIRAEEEKYDRLIQLARDDEEQRQTLERNKEDAIKKLEAKKLKEKQKQAKANKAFAVAEIAINTAVAVMRAYSDAGPFAGTVFAAIIAALGAVQIAAVLSTPIPKYKDGVDNLDKNQIAMINDGSYKEYVERNGRILSTDKKDAVVGLQKGDTVYKNYDDMVSRSKLFKIKNTAAVSKFNEDKLLKDVTNSIVKGFHKAKINNTVNVNQSSDNSSYAEKMSRWT